MTYDVKKVTIVVDGTYLTGFSEDTKVSAEKEEESMIEHVSVDGDVDFSVNANESGIITIPLKSTSPSIRHLNQLANAKKVFPISVIDLNENGTNASGPQGFVKNPIFPEKGKEISDAEFEVFVGKLKIE